MNILNKIKQVISVLGTLPFLLLVIFVAAAIALVLTLFGTIESKTLVGFLGIMIGGGIAASTSLLVAQENRRGQLAIAALDRRLETHQKAYSIWHDIWTSIHHEEQLRDILSKAFEFWKNNCLYLEPVSRQAFRDCIQFAASHKDLLNGPRTDEAKKLVNESWDIIMAPGRLLVEGVELPSLGEDQP